MDGQDFSHSDLNYMTLTSEGGRRCVWCDSECVEAAHKCQPLDYLLHFGAFKETFEVAQCTDASSTIPFLTMADITLTEDYDTIDWGNWQADWATTSIAAGAWQSAAPLIIATQNSRSGSDGYWLRMNYGTVSASSVQFMKEEPKYVYVATATYQQRLADGPFSFSFGASGGTESFSFPSVDLSAYIHNGSEFKDKTMLEMEILCDQSTCLDTIRVGGDGDVGTWTVSGISSGIEVTVNSWLTVSVSLTTSETVFNGSIPWTALSQSEKDEAEEEEVLTQNLTFTGLGVTIQNIDITNSRGDCDGTRKHGSDEKASLVAFDRAFHVEVPSGTTTTTSSTSTSSSSTSSSSSSSSSSSTSSTSSSTTSSSSTSSSTTSSSRTSSTSSSSTSSSSTSSSSTSSSSTSTSTVSTSSTSFSSTSTGTSSSSTTTSSSSTSSTSASTSTTVSVTGSSRTSTSSSDTFTATSTSSWATSTTSSSTEVSRTSTSITESTSVAQNLQAAVLLELEQATDALLGELFSSNQNSTAAVASSPVGTMAAVKLPDLSSVNDSFIPAILEDSPAAAILPAEALELAPGAALVMTTFNGGNGSANPLGSGISASGSDGKSLASVVDAVDISLVDVGCGWAGWIQAQYFRQMEWKNRKTHRYEAASCTVNFLFLKEVSQNCFVFDVAYPLQSLRKSRRLASFRNYCALH
eukprot:s2473_g1.t1